MRHGPLGAWAEEGHFVAGAEVRGAARMESLEHVPKGQGVAISSIFLPSFRFYRFSLFIFPAALVPSILPRVLDIMGIWVGD
jgi:hypothetical protein